VLLHPRAPTNVVPSDAAMVTLVSVARQLNRSPATLIRWAATGRFPRFVLVGSRKYVFADDVPRGSTIAGEAGHTARTA
jgi:hypothetical protein